MFRFQNHAGASLIQHWFLQVLRLGRPRGRLCLGHALGYLLAGLRADFITDSSWFGSEILDGSRWARAYRRAHPSQRPPAKFSSFLESIQNPTVHIDCVNILDVISEASITYVKSPHPVLCVTWNMHDKSCNFIRSVGLRINSPFVCNLYVLVFVYSFPYVFVLIYIMSVLIRYLWYHDGL